jgi:hypothetical protein
MEVNMMKSLEVLNVLVDELEDVANNANVLPADVENVINDIDAAIHDNGGDVTLQSVGLADLYYDLRYAALYLLLKLIVA